ncbi:flocculation protein FLO11-like isoform X2 [Cheilinus undulatus]|uniref:flocculation protein FLO11-like isoform X2 n=1 Tax=Cheilinus undulatus TaxID=241271 RepID=UPI001BD6005F|nr:flocculation protein FLO11-like isoform X2 [Cheilinus undulatus]
MSFSMASETTTTVQTSYVHENDDADDDWENIPPEGEVQVGDAVGGSSAQQSGENPPLSNTCTFSTPAPPSSKIKAKSRLSGLQSALTPILKYLNISNKCLSPGSLKQCDANSQKSNEDSNRHPDSQLSSSHPGQPTVGTNAPMRLLEDEYLPEITLLDVTCDSTMQVTRNDSALPDSVPATPVTAQTVCSSFTSHQPSKLNVSSSLNTTSQMLSMKMDDPPESAFAPLRWLDDRYFPEITLLDVTRDSELSPAGERSSMNITQDISPADTAKTNMDSSELNGQTAAEFKRDSELLPASERSSINVTLGISPTGTAKNNIDSSGFSGQTAAEPNHESEPLAAGEQSPLNVTLDISPAETSRTNMASSESATLDIIQSEDLSSTLEGNATHTISSFHEQSNVTKPSLELTRDISMSNISGNSRPSLAESEQNMPNIHTIAEDTPGTHPVNVTHDMSSSSDMSVQSAKTQFSTSDMQCDTSSKTVTSEVQPVSTTNTEELHTSHNSHLSSLSPKTSGSANDTFTVGQTASLSSSSSLSSTAQTPQNKTLDLPAEGETKDSATHLSRNITENSPVVNFSALKTKGTCEVQNATFDRNSFQKSSGNSTLGEAAAGTFCLQNNTFDTRPTQLQNGTITLSEKTDGHQNTLDKPSTSKVCDVTSSPKNTTSEIQPCETSKQNRSTTNTDPNAKTSDVPESTFEADPQMEKASGLSKRETKDSSQSGLPMTDSLSDSSVHQSRDLESNKANTFLLDDTLDLAAAALITSTPMPSCKVFNFNNEREVGKISGATKKLYGDVPNKPDSPVTSDIPPNIVCDRKTFLTKPAAKSLLPPSKSTSHLLKYKPASLLPGKFELPTAGLPMTRQRTQAEALRSTAASDVPQVPAGIPNSYNLRATTTGSKLPNSGLRKPQSSGIPSGIQRATAGLRPPTTRSNAPAPPPPSSDNDKPRSPAATKPATKMAQGKKHPLSRAETLQVAAKRRRTDAPLSSNNAEASSSSSDAANRAKNLKQPTTNQRALPAKTQREAAAPACTASGDAVSRSKALRQPGPSLRGLLAKPQAHGCANCVALEEQLKKKSEEIKKLKEELQKYRKEEEEC